MTDEAQPVPVADEPITTAETAATSAPEAVAAPVEATAPAPAAGEDEDELISLASARKLRREAQSLRDRIAALEAETVAKAVEAEAKVKASVAEQIEALARENRSLRIEGALNAELRAANVADERLARRAIDTSKVEFGDDGTPTNIADLVSAALDEFPSLRGGATVATAKPVNTANPASPHQSLTSDVLERMPASERIRNWDQIAAEFRAGNGVLR